MPDERISLKSVDPPDAGKASGEVRLLTSRGAIAARFHAAESGDGAVLWVFGSGGGLGGPAGGVYTRLGQQLFSQGVSSLELAYRRPGTLVECVLDVLVGLAWLRRLGRKRFILVGHSFGGAVVLDAAAQAPDVIAVAALSSQTAGVGDIAALSPRPLLFVHGEADEILPVSCSRQLFARADQPKQLRLYPGCRHGLDQCREQLDADLRGWILDAVARD